MTLLAGAIECGEISILINHQPTDPSTSLEEI